MAIRGGGDPTLKPWLSSRCVEWARRPELRRRCACLHHGSDSRGSTEYKAVARTARPSWRAPPRIVVAWPTAGKARPTNLGWHRARDRQGQVASRWPAATLDGHCARRPIGNQVGTRRWLAYSVEQGDGRWKNELDKRRPIQGFRSPG